MALAVDGRGGGRRPRWRPGSWYKVAVPVTVVVTVDRDGRGGHGRRPWRWATVVTAVGDRCDGRWWALAGVGGRWWALVGVIGRWALVGGGGLRRRWRLMEY